MPGRNPMRRVIGTDAAVEADRHVNGTAYDVLECGHRFRPDGRSAPAGLAKRRACVNCAAVRQNKDRGTVILLVRVEDASPGGANLKVRSRTTALVWWLTRHNADFGTVRVGADCALTLGVDDAWMPHYALKEES